MINLWEVGEVGITGTQRYVSVVNQKPISKDQYKTEVEDLEMSERNRRQQLLNREADALATGADKVKKERDTLTNRIEGDHVKISTERGRIAKEVGSGKPDQAIVDNSRSKINYFKADTAKAAAAKRATPRLTPTKESASRMFVETYLSK